MYDELHGIATVGGGQLGAVAAGQWWVEQLQQGGLHVDGGDDGGSRQPGPVRQHHPGGATAARLDALHDGAGLHRAAPPLEPAHERAGQGLRPAARVPLPEKVVGGLPEDVERPAGLVRSGRGVAGE